MELPHALAPWAAMLELFPRELATALGPLIQRLDLVIGPLQVSARQGDGDPDGFHGITRRGGYERLLISEWLLAEELPEEFARRAVMGEHGFLELARRQPAGANTSVALFDAGPDQLGAPRLVHIAALIVLARRAEAAGARFQWGVLQQPPDTVHTSLYAHSILKLLQARSLREVSDTDVACWREHVGSLAGADDLWIVGRDRLRALPAVQGASLLRVVDPYLPEGNSLHAIVTDGGRTKPTVTLELPPAPVCVRLLRDPFMVRRAEPRRFMGKATPISHLTFAPGGRKLLARSGVDHVMVYPIPNSPHEPAGKPRACHTMPPRPILAAGRLGKSLVLVTTTERADELCVEYVGRNSGRFEPMRLSIPSELGIRPPSATDPLPLCFPVNEQSDAPQWLVALNNRLLRLNPYAGSASDPAPYITVEMEHVMTGGPAHAGYAFIGQEAATSTRWVWLSIRSGNQQPPRFIVREFDRPPIHACFGYEGDYAYWDSNGSILCAVAGIVAVEHEPGHWIVLLDGGDVRLHTLPNDRVQGLVLLSGEGIVGSEASDDEPGLIVLKQDRRRISVMGQNWVRSVPPASSPIVHFAVSHYGPDIAYLTEQGELVVYSLAQQAILCRYETGAEQ
jgi:hypothetical protein